VSAAGCSRRRFLQLAGAAAGELVLARVASAAPTPAVSSADALKTAVQELQTLVQTRALIVDDPWVLMHAVLPLGRDARRADGPILDHVMRTHLAPVTRAGTRYPAFPLGVEAHPNHFLEIMYAVDVPADRPFATVLGTTTRADLYAGARALFSPTMAGSELPWTVSVFTAEMPPSNDRFENADRKGFGVGALVEAAARTAEKGYADAFAAMDGKKPYGRSALQGFPCNGTHAIDGLLDALARGYEAADLKGRVRRLIQAAIFRLEHEPALIDKEIGGSNSPVGVLNADAAKLQLIGHTLENLTAARRHGIYEPNASEGTRIAAAERELAAIIGRLTRVHDIDALAQQVPRAYAVLLGDACHALHALDARTA
jgi:hypothetical protein